MSRSPISFLGLRGLWLKRVVWVVASKFQIVGQGWGQPFFEPLWKHTSVESQPLQKQSIFASRIAFSSIASSGSTPCLSASSTCSM